MLQSIDYVAILPELILGGTALLVLVVDLFLPGDRKWLAMPLSMMGVLGSLGALLAIAGEGRETFCVNNQAGACSYVVDDFAVLFKVIFLITAVVVLLLSLNYFEEGRFYQGEYYFLLLCAFFGMLTISSSRDLIMLFISLEIVSLPGFVISGFRKSDSRSSESALKFFLIGVLATAVMLFGMSVVYGLTGSVQLSVIGETFGQQHIDGQMVPAAVMAVALVIVGFAFKISAAPFHFWAPDTYQGAPVPVAAFLSVASKAAGFTGLMTVCYVGFRDYTDVWAPLLGVLAVLTMTWGNLVAMQQRHMVRLLAYSSVAQAGYMLVPFALVQSGPGSSDVNEAAFSAVLLYLLAYAVTNIGAFACVVAVARQHPGRQLDDYKGLGTVAPGIAIALTLFLLSLAGVLPIAVGFYAKLFILRPVLVAPTTGGIILASAVVVNTLVGLFYYLAVAKRMWMDPAEEGRQPIRAGLALNFTIVVLAAAVLVLGIYPSPFATPASRSTLVTATASP